MTQSERYRIKLAKFQAVPNRPTFGRRRTNEWEMRGNTAVIFLDRLDGKRLECLVDAADLELALSHPNKWTAAWSEESRTFYVTGRGTLIHRLITSAPPNMEVDHGNHNGLDNRRSNLTVCTTAQNSRNRRPRTKAKAGSSSEYKGVYASNGKYRAQVSINSRRYDVARYFDTPEAAHAVIEQFHADALRLLDNLKGTTHA